MDAIFGVENFRNEIIWKRTHAHGGAKRCGPVHDTILFYTKSDKYKWHPKATEYSEKYIKGFFKPDKKDLALCACNGRKRGEWNKIGSFRRRFLLFMLPPPMESLCLIS
jgi:hypothetical protein